MNYEKQSQLNLNGKCSLIATAYFSGIKADILIGGENSPMTVMELTVEPNMGAPAHISHGEDKVFFIIEGSLAFLVGNQKIQAHEGERIFVGKGTPHSFVALDNKSARMNLVSTPGRHDRFFLAMGQLSTPHKMEEVRSVCERFEQTILGPVIDAK